MKENSISDKEKELITKLSSPYFIHTVELDTLRLFFTENRSLIKLSMLFSAFKYKFSYFPKSAAEITEFVKLAENTGYAIATGKHTRKGKFFKYFDNVRKILAPFESEKFFLPWH